MIVINSVTVTSNTNNKIFSAIEKYKITSAFVSNKIPLSEQEEVYYYSQKNNNIYVIHKFWNVIDLCFESKYSIYFCHNKELKLKSVYSLRQLLNERDNDINK